MPNSATRSMTTAVGAVWLYIYIHMHVCIHIHIHIYIRPYVYIHIYQYTYKTVGSRDAQSDGGGGWCAIHVQ